METLRLGEDITRSSFRLWVQVATIIFFLELHFIVQPYLTKFTSTHFIWFSSGAFNLLLLFLLPPLIHLFSSTQPFSISRDCHVCVCVFCGVFISLWHGWHRKWRFTLVFFLYFFFSFLYRGFFSWWLRHYFNPRLFQKYKPNKE